MLALLTAPLSRAAAAADIRILEVEPDGFAWVRVTGEFEADDGPKFAVVTARLHRAVVMMDSPGGALIAGLQMGEVIRLKHYATYSPPGAMCTSACALAWLGGTPRLMQPASKIGFHAAYDADTKEPTGAGNALVGAYMMRLGLSDAAIIDLEKTGWQDVTWLTPARAGEFGIQVTLLTGEPQPRPAAAPGAPAAEPARPRQTALLPFLVTPIEPLGPAEAATLDEQAATFARDYFAHWSEGNDESLDFFGGVYAPRVLFYGQSLDRPVVLQQKRDYAERWPVRVYGAQPASVRSFCNPATATCVVTGMVDWDCRNPGHHARSTGTANFSLTVSFAKQGGQILAESGTVVAKTVN